MGERVKVMVNGLPGNMATCVAKHVLKERKFFELLGFSLTGPKSVSPGAITDIDFDGNVQNIVLIHPEEREEAIASIREKEGGFISVDFTQPSAVNSNAEFYCKHLLPFVMGTTGGDREKLRETVENSNICALIAPNMAAQIVGFQAMMEFAANTFPLLFAEYSLEIQESHQSNKKDTSGTAKAMVEYFKKLGVRSRNKLEPFSVDDIVKIRDSRIQQTVLGVPREHLAGHGWHTYTLRSPDGTVFFQFTHNVNGRDVYALGALHAIAFLNHKLKDGVKGRVFTMIDALKWRG